MGAWTDQPFGNDAALDWIVVLEQTPSAAWFEVFSRVLENFRCFEESRIKAENFVLRTPEMAQTMIAMFQAPVAPIIANTILDGVGKLHEYPGDDETFVLVAAAELIRWRLDGKSVATVGHLLMMPLDAVPVSLAQKFATELKSVKLNRMLVNDHGRRWLRNVNELSRVLDGAVEPKLRN